MSSRIPPVEGKGHEAASLQLGMAVGLVGISLWRLDLATQRIQLNDWGYELIGQVPHPQGMPIELMRQCIHPDDRAAVEEAAREAVETGSIVDAEARYRRPDGSYRHLLTRRRVERGEQGQPVALVGISLDITEQVRARERAAQITQSIDLIADATGVGVWSTDVESRQTTWNRQMRRIYDLPDDISTWEARRIAIERTDPADRARLDACFHDLVAHPGEARELAFTLQWPDGQKRWVVGRGKSTVHGGRAVVFGVFIDVTEQRRTQQRLQHAEERAMLAATAVGLAIWERDLVSGDSWWDAQMYRLRGLPEDAGTPDELRHKSIHPDDLAFVERRTAEIIDHENDYYFDFRVRWPDGTVKWLATRGSVVRDESGRALRILGFNWDVTEHKLAEDMRREKAAAEQASRAKSEFLSRMSHELRTPLNAVLGFAQLLLDDPSQPLAEKQRERARHIGDAGQHLLALIDDVLELTSVEVGNVPFAMAVVEVAPVVHDTLQWIQPMAQRAKVHLSIAPMEGAVRADPRRLRQVLANLLSNAVKYNRPQGRVEVGLIDDAAKDGMLGIRVRDTGRGLTDAQMQRLFEPFNRLGAEREGIEGTGIGLTIVRALVEHMGGAVEVRSRAGEGCEFRVWLQAAGPDDAAAAGGPDRSSMHDAVAALREIDVLYIEDNALNVMLVTELVTMRPNVRLHIAKDGCSGVARVAELRPRAVLIDLQLPDIDGYEVLRRIRADHSLDGVTCVALSANAMPEDIARARQWGFDDYWTKPIDFTNFLAGLDRFAGAA